MDSAEIYRKLTHVLRDVFDNEQITATPELTAKQVKGWDSLAHIRVVLSVEQAFRVRFSAAEVSKLSNVGDFAALIQAKLKP